MITDLYRYFEYDFSNLESKLISLIKNNWILVCVWISDGDHILPLPTDDPQQKYYAGYYMYMLDNENKKILQIREEITQEITGEVWLEENSTQVSFVSEDVLRSMIFNAYTQQRKNVFNSEIDSLYEDDFFIQWTINENEPDRIFLLEPEENWRSKTFDEEKWKKVLKYILHWANRYPQYNVVPSYNYARIAEAFQFLYEKGFYKEVIDRIYQIIPNIFSNYGSPLEEYCRKLEERFGENYSQKGPSENFV